MEIQVLVDCPKCEAKVNADVLSTDVIRGPDEPYPDYRYCFSRCPSCHQTLLIRQECTGDNDWEDYTWANGVRVWPSPEREAHKAIPPVVQVSLDEAYRCHFAGAQTACAVMCGRALEGVCVHFGIKSVLAKGLGELRQRALIDERLYSWGEQLRKHRNLAAHATEEKISREDAKDLLEFVAAICEYIFVLTARFDAFMARKAPKAAVPPLATIEESPATLLKAKTDTEQAVVADDPAAGTLV
jgi:hypothetical protein